MSISGEKGGKSIKQGTSVFDLVTGLYAYSGIVTALLQRKETGRGQRVETSLMESQVSFLVDAAMEYLIAGQLREKWGSEHSQIVPYKVFSTTDGEVVIGAGYQTVYEPFVRAIEREDLITDPRFATLAARVENRNEMYRILDAEVMKYTNAEIIARLDKVGVPNAPVNNIAQVFNHPQLLHRRMLLSLDHPQYGVVPAIGSAVKYSGFDVEEGWRAPPLLNDGADSVLEDWLGISRSRQTARATKF